MPEWDEQGNPVTSWDEQGNPAPAQKAPADIFKDLLGRAGSFGTTPNQEDIQAGNRENIGQLAVTGMTAAPMLAGIGALPAAGRAFLGMSGMQKLGAVGTLAKEGAKFYGADKVMEHGLGLSPATRGAVLAGAGFMSPGAAARGAIKRLLGGGEAAAPVAAEAATAATQSAELAATVKAEAQAAKAALAERALAIKEAESAARIADRARLTDARIAAIEARASGKAARVPKAAVKPSPPAAPPTEGATALQPEPDFIDPSAVKVLPFPPAKGTVKPATNLGGAAKPGPPGTPASELEAKLQATLDSVKAGKPAGSLRGKSPILDEALTNAEGMHQREATAGMTERVVARRKEIGADKLARELGMNADVIRSDAGDVVGEALGAHSPIIPEAAWKKIMDKMRSLPPGERPAYVAKASDWARPQIEQLRRMYEYYGMALPAALAGGAVAGSVDQ